MDHWWQRWIAAAIVTARTLCAVRGLFSARNLQRSSLALTWSFRAHSPHLLSSPELRWTDAAARLVAAFGHVAGLGRGHA
jgi:hypothetical protein